MSVGTRLRRRAGTSTPERLPSLVVFRPRQPACFLPGQPKPKQPKPKCNLTAVASIITIRINASLAHIVLLQAEQTQTTPCNTTPRDDLNVELPNSRWQPELMNLTVDTEYVVWLDAI